MDFIPPLALLRLLSARPPVGRLTPCRLGQRPGLATVIGAHRSCVGSHGWQSTVH